MVVPIEDFVALFGGYAFQTGPGVGVVDVMSAVLDGGIESTTTVSAPSKAASSRGNEWPPELNGRSCTLAASS